MLAIILPLGLTFYAWKITSESAHQRSQTQFEALVTENEKALQHRMDSYEHALLGGAAYFKGSEHITPQEWRDYVETIDLEENFPGISGLGLIRAVKESDLPRFIAQTQQEQPHFQAHPAVKSPEHYIISNIEPPSRNLPAIGLDITFEQNRRQAAELSRDSGHPAITRKIILVQDSLKKTGLSAVASALRHDHAARFGGRAPRGAGWMGLCRLHRPGSAA